MPIRRTFRSKPRGPENSEPSPGAPDRATLILDSDASQKQEPERILARMADTLNVWLDHTAPWVAAFWEESIAETIEEVPAAVIALSAEDLRAVKEDAAGLIASARTHVQRRLVDDRSDDWPHLKPQTDPHDPDFQRTGAMGPFEVSAAGPGTERSAPSLVEGRLDGVLGDVASLFEHHHVSLSGFTRGDPFGHRGRWHPNRSHKPAWSDEMLEAMSLYSRLHDDYAAALAEAQDLSAEQRRLQAAQLWDTA
jgi:hypothetical protein